MSLTFKHTGKLGDIIYALPTIRALGGGTLYIGQTPLGAEIRAPFRTPNLPMDRESIADAVAFFKTVPFLASVRPHAGEAVDVNLDLARNHACKYRHLARWYLELQRVDADLAQPWLTHVAPRPLADVVVQHGMRYFDPRRPFGWEALRPYVDRCVFVGFPAEHAAFVRYSGLPLRLHRPDSLLDFAQIVRGSRLFVGNQSVGFALAEAMKHPRVQQVCVSEPNCLPQSTNGRTALTAAFVEACLEDGATDTARALAPAAVRLRNGYYAARYFTDKVKRALMRRVKGARSP